MTYSISYGILNIESELITMFEKICKSCGKPFTTDNNRKRLCNTCKEHNREKHAKEYCVKYSKEKRQAISIAKEDNDILEKISASTKMSKAKIIHVLLENFIETY